jgi:diphosphomevalonate decarboxylase
MSAERSAQGFIKQVLEPAKLNLQAVGAAFAPANIALIKYWGKRDARLNLPLTSSLSVSLGARGSRTEVQCREADQVILNGQPLPEDHVFVRRLAAFLDGFRSAAVPGFRVETVNTVPTAAGLASSASGFAALVKALNELFGWQLSPRRLSLLARLGSGSAARSLFDGFVQWHAGERDDGLDSFAEPVGGDWPGFRVGVLELSAACKPVGSREGMQRTASTSPLFEKWPQTVAQDLQTLRRALDARDFKTVGETAEQNALTMHALMLSARPPLCYWLPESVAVMRRIWQLREEGLELYFTMDAGPNVKLLFLKDVEAAVKAAFPQVRVIAPFEGLE